MNRRIDRTSAAVQDVVENAIYLGEQSPGLETKFLDAVELSLSRLADASELGGIYETANPRLQGIRVWRVDGFEKYLLFYRSTAESIDLIRLLHGSRDIAAIFEAD